MVHRTLDGKRTILTYTKNMAGDRYMKNTGPVPLTSMVKMTTGERVHVEFAGDYDGAIFNGDDPGDGLGSHVFLKITHLLAAKIA